MPKKSWPLRITLVVCTLIIVCSSSFADKAKPDGESTPKKKTETVKSTETKTELIDLNSATLEQLIQIPGIGDVWAQKIIDNRPYKDKSELKSRKIIPSGTYSKIQKKVTAK